MKTDIQTEAEVVTPSPSRNWRPALVAGAALVLIGVVLFGVSRFGVDRTEVAGSARTLLEVLEEDGRFDSFLGIVGRYDFWVNQLSDEEDETVLAPSDEVFDALSDETAVFLEDPANERAVIDLLLRHIVVGEYSQEQLSELETLTMSPPMRNSLVSSENGTVTITPRASNDAEMNGVTVVEWDIDASNGVIHVVDGLMLPAELGS